MSICLSALAQKAGPLLTHRYRKLGLVRLTPDEVVLSSVTFSSPSGGSTEASIGVQSLLVKRCSLHVARRLKATRAI